MTDSAERWLDVAGNRGEWERLRRALALEDGFALFVVDVPDTQTEDRVVELLAAEREQLVVMDARSSAEQAPVRELLGRESSTAVLRSVEASRWDIEGLERCLVQLNARRDQIVARGHVLVIVVRRDTVARVPDVAPDLYSVHRARFRFAQLVRPQPAPLWLLTIPEFAALVDDDGRPFEDRIGHYYDVFWTDVERFSWPMDSASWTLSGSDVAEFIAARIFARHEGVRCLVDPPRPQLAAVLECPHAEIVAIISDLCRVTAPVCDRLSHIIASARTWLHLQQSELVEAHAALAEAVARSRGAIAQQRARLLGLQLATAEGVPNRTDYADAISMGRSVFEQPASTSMELSLAAIAWESWPGAEAVSRLGRALHGIHSSTPNRWRFETYIRSLSRELVGAAVSDWEDALQWLHERHKSPDSYWDATWVLQVMVERALEHPTRVAELVELGKQSLNTSARFEIYEVWRPLVGIHAEIRDAATLESLIRMALGLLAPNRFGPRLPAALHVVADILDRGLIELPSNERDQLRARAAAREALPLAMRLGWWAIELALEDR